MIDIASLAVISRSCTRHKHFNKAVLYSSSLCRKGLLVSGHTFTLGSIFENGVKESIEVTDVADPPQQLPWKVLDGTTSPVVTGVGLPKLVELGKILNAVPEDFQLHPAIKRIFKERVKSIETGSNIDIGLAEALAYASLATDGFRVRLGGQDSIRGTFSHRHSTVQCQKTFRRFNIFSALDNGGNIKVLNSLLSETAAMAFEYGYGLETPQILNIWEAQFGDFANVAQPIIDEFIVSAETKWAQRSICNVSVFASRVRRAGPGP